VFYTLCDIEQYKRFFSIDFDAILMKLLMFVEKAMAHPTLAFVVIYVHFVSEVAMGTNFHLNYL